MTITADQPCPFCNGAEVDIDGDAFGCAAAYCINCGAQGPNVSVGQRGEVLWNVIEQEAMELWNARGAEGAAAMRAQREREDA